MPSDVDPSDVDPTDVGSLLWLARDLRRRGIEPARHRQEGAKVWRPVHRGVWIRSSDWGALRPVDRYAAMVHAASRLADPDRASTLSHESAAALWGMPRIDAWPDVIHVSGGDRRVRSSGRVVRHHRSVGETAERGGLRVTTAARTAIDLARTTSLGNALAAADHSLRQGLCTAKELQDEVAVVPRGARGRTSARLVAGLADGRSMSPGESLSRAQMFVLNLPRPELQIEHRDEDGLIGVVDFQWDGLVGEFDGRVKYGVGKGGTPEQLADVLWREKQREDRLRRRGQAVARWVWADAVNTRRLARRLEQHGLRPEPRNSWFADPGSAL